MASFEDYQFSYKEFISRFMMIRHQSSKILGKFHLMVDRITKEQVLVRSEPTENND
jgi:hypothetical protein